MYPNPANNNLNVLVKGLDLTNNSTLDIYDVTGKLVASLLVNKTDEVKTIDVANFAQGIYFVRLYNQQTAYTQKWIKE